MFAVTILGYTLGVIWYMVIVTFWLFLAFIPAQLAKAKGHGFWGWFLLSLFFWWVTLFIAIFMKNKNPALAASEPAEE